MKHDLIPFLTDKIEAGVDEVGRGCLAGDVVAAAVILPKDYRHSSLTDSKQISASQRLVLRKDILKNAIAVSVAQVSPQEIDRLNILWASIKAMHVAIEGLSVQPEVLLIDGNRFVPYQNISHRCIVKGDSKILSIAAASIIAKTHRDELMQDLAKTYPQYAWEQNMGYPTKKHYEGIQKYGITPLHRQSFKLFK